MFVDPQQVKTGINVGFLILAGLAILFLVTKYGYIHCSTIPHWCKVYATINKAIYGRSYPLILILHGDRGLGDPLFLEKYIRNKCHYNVHSRDIGSVSLGNLENFDVVVVEKARYLTADQLEMLWDFVAKGGKLVIIGDVGVEGPEEEYLTWEDLGEKNKEGIVNPWDRKKEDGTIIDFGSSLLGLKFYGIYGEKNSFSGELRTEDDILTDGMPRILDLNTAFAVTKPYGTSVLGSPKVVAYITGVGSVGGARPPYPAAVRIGYRLIYLAYPPEEGGLYHLLLLRNLCRVVT